ncbi:MAG TPA: redoxin domain-containing protein, partial [Candidatus Saccharimonadales bacterium]|nr:redoxin domain-containing protein [Candidatus Saccharimonadales bacterium]
YECDFALKKGKGISGVVLLPDGSPAQGAALLLVERGESGSLIMGGQLRGSSSSDVTRTDAQGHFEFPAKLDAAKVFASHEQGYAEANAPDLVKNGKMTLQKWAQVKGFMRVGEPGGTDASVQLQGHSEQATAQDGRFTGISFGLKTEPNPDGSFEFDKVPPGEHHLDIEYRFKDDRDGNQALSHGFSVAMKPGETKEPILGGTGRRLLGQIKLLGGDVQDLDWKRDVHRLTLVLPNDPAAANVRGGFLQESIAVLTGLNTPSPAMNEEAMRAFQRAQRTYVLLMETNGAFHIDNVPPGKYLLNMDVSDPDEEYYNRRSIGSLSKEVLVPDEPNAKVNAPLQIGTLEVTIRPRVKIGMTVPSFEAKTKDGKSVDIAKLRGKPILIYFWGLSLGYSSYDLQVLKEFQTSYGAAGKLTILGCNLDTDSQQAEQFAKTQGMTWTQTYLGNWSQTPVAGMFGINGNSVAALIDSQGKLVNGQLRGSNLRTALSTIMAGE